MGVQLLPLLNELFIVEQFSITLGTFTTGQDKYDMTSTLTNIPEGYTPIGILGYSMSGVYFSHVFFSRLTLDTNNPNIVNWSAKNTASSATNTITCTLSVLLKKDLS